MKELHCWIRFESADFGHLPRSLSMIWRDIQVRIWGMDGLIHPLKTAKIVWNGYQMTKIPFLFIPCKAPASAARFLPLCQIPSSLPRFLTNISCQILSYIV